MPVSDVRSKKIPIALDKTRHLRYDFNALALLEEKFGSLDAALQNLGKSASVKGLRALLHAGLVYEDPALTEEQVGAMVTLTDLPRIAQAINDAFKEAMPQVDPQSPPASPEASQS